MTPYYTCLGCNKKFKSLKAFNDHDCENLEDKEEQMKEMEMKV